MEKLTNCVIHFYYEKIIFFCLKKKEKSLIFFCENKINKCNRKILKELLTEQPVLLCSGSNNIIAG